MNNKEIRVFLCEDDESLGLMLQEYLIAKDYEVDLFTDGDTGLEAFGQEDYAPVSYTPLSSSHYSG